MLLFGVCFVLYFIKLSAGKGIFMELGEMKLLLITAHGLTRIFLTLGQVKINLFKGRLDS